MRVEASRAADGLRRYLSQEVLKVSDPVRKFALLFAVNSMDSSRAVDLARRIGLAALFDTEGYVDTSDVRKGLEGAFASVHELDVLGLRFTLKDVDPVIASMEQ